jgi:hypothetical protein
MAPLSTSGLNNSLFLFSKFVDAAILEGVVIEIVHIIATTTMAHMPIPLAY